ncbi:hypothetical protein BpHYR1_011914, partial [Brachionus plicatilis]
MVISGSVRIKWFAEDVKSKISTLKEDKKTLNFVHNLGEEVKFTSRGNKLEEIVSIFEKKTVFYCMDLKELEKLQSQKKLENQVILRNQYEHFVSCCLDIKNEKIELNELIDIANNVLTKSE